MFENIFWINHVHDTRWQVFSARSVQTSVKILGETEDNEKLIFSLDSGHNVWELGARQPGRWGACYKLFGLWPSPVLSVVVDTNPGKRGWREIIFRVNSQEKCAGKSFLWLVIIVFLRSPFEEMLVGYNYFWLVWTQTPSSSLTASGYRHLSLIRTKSYHGPTSCIKQTSACARCNHSSLSKSRNHCNASRICILISTINLPNFYF